MLSFDYVRFYSFPVDYRLVLVEITFSVSTFRKLLFHFLFIRYRFFSSHNFVYMYIHLWRRIVNISLFQLYIPFVTATAGERNFQHVTKIRSNLTWQPEHVLTK